jgi:hypothetical protein
MMYSAFQFGIYNAFTDIGPSEYNIHRSHIPSPRHTKQKSRDDEHTITKPNPAYTGEKTRTTKTQRS